MHGRQASGCALRCSYTSGPQRGNLSARKGYRARPRRAHLGCGQVQQRVGAVGHEDLQRARLQQVALVVHLARMETHEQQP